MVISPFLVMNYLSVKDVNIVAVVSSFENDQDSYGYHRQNVAIYKDRYIPIDGVERQQNQAYHQNGKVGGA